MPDNIIFLPYDPIEDIDGEIWPPPSFEVHDGKLAPCLDSRAGWFWSHLGISHCRSGALPSPVMELDVLVEPGGKVLRNTPFKAHRRPDDVDTYMDGYAYAAYRLIDGYHWGDLYCSTRGEGPVERSVVNDYGQISMDRLIDYIVGPYGIQCGYPRSLPKWLERWADRAMDAPEPWWIGGSR